MSLFKFVKKKEEQKNCSCRVVKAENVHTAGDVSVGKIKNIKVLGAGCKSCHQQYEYTKKAAQEIGISAEVEYITDMEKVMAYGIMSMPAIVVNGKVAAQGKVLKPADVVKLLKKECD